MIAKQILALLIATLPVIAAGAQALELASPFADGAVLQRGMEVPVWGWAEPGGKVTVAFAGQTKTADADANGKWMVILAPLTSSADQQDLTVRTAAGETISRSGVLVGEVWLASGQSNMDWLAGKSNCNTLAREVAKSKLPIREYTVDTGSSLFLSSRAQSEEGWKGPEKAGGFSALALAFAADLQRELGVPVGIIRASHGATPVETWTAYEGFAGQPELQDIARLVRESDPGTPEGKAAYARYYEEVNTWQAESAKLVEKGGQPMPRPKLPGIAGDWKGATRMHNKKVAPLIPFAIRGVIWCQGEHNSGEGKIYAAKMEALLNGWRKLWNRPELPFYFTQLQCYGGTDPNQVGFADAREAQTLFYQNNKHVGMVVQTDLNPARPEGIHPYNKLDPGKRMARWALAHEYGKKDLAFTGPMYESHQVVDGKVRVMFEQRGPGGGLMVGSKGMEEDSKADPNAFVEPARETAGEPLQHFRLAGKDRIWHAAKAVIDGDAVMVSCPEVPAPVGVQYAYSASPIGSNLYNRAGLPAAPFAVFDGKPLFQEDLPTKNPETPQATGPKGSLRASSLMRNGIVLQRDQAVPVWGHGIPGNEITVAFAGQEKKTTVDEFERWSVDLEPMPASAEGRDLEIRSSAEEKRVIRDVLIGDVWFITGSNAISNELFRYKAEDPAPGEALPLVREFRVKTKTRRFQTPRKDRMEIGGGKYVSSWEPASFGDPDKAPTVFGYHFAKQVQKPGVPLGLVTLGAENPPLTWMSLEGMQTAKGFEKERDEINLAYPNTEACQKALAAYIAEMKAYVAKIAALRKEGKEVPDELANSTPAFPTPPYNEWQSYTGTATHTYNFCISPNTPCAVRGVVWVPSESNLGGNRARYTPALEAYARSLPDTYDQPKVPFVYAQPSAKLVDGIGKPQIDNAVSIEFEEWPESLQDIATKLGAAAAGNFK